MSILHSPVPFLHFCSSKLYRKRLASKFIRNENVFANRTEGDSRHLFCTRTTYVIHPHQHVTKKTNIFQYVCVICTHTKRFDRRSTLTSHWHFEWGKSKCESKCKCWWLSLWTFILLFVCSSAYSVLVNTHHAKTFKLNFGHQHAMKLAFKMNTIVVRHTHPHREYCRYKYFHRHQYINLIFIHYFQRVVTEGLHSM